MPYHFNPFLGNFDEVLDAGAYIRKDGSTTTTGEIPFAEGWSIADNEFGYVGDPAGVSGAGIGGAGFLQMIEDIFDDRYFLISTTDADYPLAIYFKPGTTTLTNGSGSYAYIQGGDGNGNGDGGGFVMAAGVAPGSGTGGSYTLSGGQSSTGPGGAVSLEGGVGATGGPVFVYGGAGGTGGGGNAELRGGSASAANARGYVAVRIASGTPGHFTSSSDDTRESLYVKKHLEIDGTTWLDGALTVVGTTTLATALSGILIATAGVVSSTSVAVTDFIKKDGSTTTTGEIPFAVGVLLSTTQKVRFTDANAFIHATSSGNLLVSASTLLTLGVAGTTELGDGTLRDLIPNTDLKMNLGTGSKRFNDIRNNTQQISSTLSIGGDATFSAGIVGNYESFDCGGAATYVADGYMTMPDGVAMSATVGIPTGAAGSILNVIFFCNATVVTGAGTVDIEVRKNNSAVFTNTITISATGEQSFPGTAQAPGVDTFISTDLIQVYVNFNTFVGTLTSTYARVRVKYNA